MTFTARLLRLLTTFTQRTTWPSTRNRHAWPHVFPIKLHIFGRIFISY